MQLFLGCPIWSFKGWVGNFYPAGTKPSDFLREYARRLTTIEGNTTFYAVPAAKTIQSWVEQMPETFRFCAKIPKAISHEGKLAPEIGRAQEFVNVLRPLGSRLGPMFLQLPPKYSPRLITDLTQFLDAFPKDVRLGVEVRHLDWFDSPNREALNQVLSSHNMARVVIDTRPIRDLAGDKILEGSTYESLLGARERKPDVPVFLERTTDFIFLRFIGHPELAQNIPFIDEWVDYLVPEMKAGATAYVICHSPENITAPNICRDFQQRLAVRIPILPLPWDELESETEAESEPDLPDIPEQPRLF
jgi:uncharacterized protein YecE (DUF72 family)